MDGLLVVISGYSGVGKGTLVKELLSRYPDEYVLSVSATSRNPRPGETHGKEYYFVTPENFRKMIEADDLLEYTVYNGNYYGTPKTFVEEMLKEGKNVILEIEVEGGLNARRIYPESFLTFVVPPSAKDIYSRLKNRGTETEEEIRARMKRAAEESDVAPLYDFIAINDDLETCIRTLHAEIRERKLVADIRKNMIPRLKEEFVELTREDN